MTVDSTDSLRSLASKINSLSAGATASIVDGGEGSAYLTISSNTSGAKGKVQLADLSGSTLSTLGVVSGASNIRTAVTDGARSFGFSSTTDSLGKMINAGSQPSGTFTIGSQSVTVDGSTDTLQTVADKVNALGGGLSATVASSTSGSTTTYQLEIKGLGSNTFGDPDNILSSIGVLEKSPANSLISAQDAEFTLDGVAFKSATNTNTTIIPGVTLTLQQGNTTSNSVTTPSTATISLSKDLSQVKGKIGGFKDAFNGLVDFMNQTSQLDAATFQTGPLFSDAITRQVSSSLTSLLFTNVPGLTGNYTNLAAVGFGLDSDGKMTLDDTQLTAALAADPTAVSNLFQTTGKATDANVTYVSSSSKSVASGTGSYNVNITQAATKATFLAGTLQTGANTTSEKLTFSGSLIGGTPYALLLDVNSTTSLTAAKINNDSKLKSLMYASVDGTTGKLRIDSKRFGTAGNFSVASNFSSSGTNSGVGVGGEGVNTAGVDVLGTINGETATGAGQFLTGSSGNANTDGLQVQYSGSSTGSMGSISTSKGMGMQVSDLLLTFTDSVSGALSAGDKTLKTQIESLGTDITTLQSRMTERTTELRNKFSKMEAAMSKAQAQGQRLSTLRSQN